MLVSLFVIAIWSLLLVIKFVVVAVVVVFVA